MLAAHGPSIVAGLLSSITSVRVKLAALDLERVSMAALGSNGEFQADLV